MLTFAIADVNSGDAVASGAQTVTGGDDLGATFPRQNDHPHHPRGADHQTALHGATSKVSHRGREAQMTELLIVIQIVLLLGHKADL